ncbi:MAG: SpoIID/LytB domain-containing protein [Acidobacteria bacterium]|nr:SpoIID/LytB domain-containing protein [Acidobacteriota bacterium]
MKLRTGELARFPREEYVAGIVAGETGDFRSAEALKAMAVAARTYAFRHMGRHKKDGYDFCDTTHCQSLRQPGDRHREAAEATEAEMLWYQGSPADTYYHANCGGATEAAEDVWPDVRAPYLRHRNDSFCDGSGWQASISEADLRRLLGLDGREPLRLEVLRRTESGRVAELSVAGRRMRALDLRALLGFRLISSTRFGLSNRGAETVFSGTGSGHGVGMCQIGAERRGQQGQTYRQILAFYYPGTTLGITAQGFPWTVVNGERVRVFGAGAADREVVAVADAQLAAAEQRTGLRCDFQPVVRIFPTVAAFRDATGEPGWVAASTRGRTIRLPPAPLLRSLGALRSTLLHEMLHVIIEARAHPSLPEWFREGIVAYLARDAPGVSSRSQPEADMRASYRAALARVRALASRHGAAAVTGWITTGIPH